MSTPKATPAQRARREREGRSRGLAAMRTVALNGRFQLSAPVKYRAALAERVKREGILRARVDLGNVDESTVYRIIAGAGISAGTLAKLMAVFDDSVLAEKLRGECRRQREDYVSGILEEIGEDE